MDNINTNLNNFLLVDQITLYNSEKIEGLKQFSDDPFYICMEALVQLGALHVRYIVNFKKHAFLLKVSQFDFYEKNSADGNYTLFGELKSRSDKTFFYSLSAEKNHQICFKGDFLFSTIEYNDAFKKDRLVLHYKEAFSCLEKNSKEN